MAEEGISAVGCEEVASGRRIWSRVSGGLPLVLWRGDRGWYCACFCLLFFFPSLPSLSFWASTKTLLGKAHSFPIVYVDSGPLTDFFMGPTEWTTGRARKGNANEPIF